MYAYVYIYILIHYHCKILYTYMYIYIYAIIYMHTWYFLYVRYGFDRCLDSGFGFLCHGGPNWIQLKPSTLVLLGCNFFKCGEHAVVPAAMTSLLEIYCSKSTFWICLNCVCRFHPVSVVVIINDSMVWWTAQQPSFQGDFYSLDWFERKPWIFPWNIGGSCRISKWLMAETL